jgi:uncharacterized protein YndB with AHSA1/START domain
VFEVNANAPVLARSEVEIDAPPEIVWEIMAAIDRWPEWNPDVRHAELRGDLREGSTFRWKAGPGTIISTLEEVSPPRRIAWTGKTFGVKAAHVWAIEPRPGGSLVKTEESWERLPVKLFRKSSQKTVEKALHDGPQHLRREAEKRA